MVLSTYLMYELQVSDFSNHNETPCKVLFSHYAVNLNLAKE